MKKYAPIIVIACAVLLIFFVIFACKSISNNNSDNNPMSPTVVPSYVPGQETPTPVPTDIPEKTPEPKETTTPEISQKPENTPSPTPTAKPTPTPKADALNSGSFKTDTGTSLNLRTDWSYKKSGEKYIVSVDVYLECYTLNVSQRNDCTLSVNGKVIYFNTDAIKFTEREFHETLLNHYEFEAKEGDLFDIEANWSFRGKYSGVQIDTLKAGGWVKVI